MRIKLSLMLVILSASATAANQNAAMQANPVDDAVQHINQITDQIALLDDTPALALVIVDHGLVRLQRTIGRTRNDAGGQPIDANTLFRAASVSKGFASTLTTLLVADQRLDFSDPVLAHVPQFQLKDPRATQALTIENLLSQRTGLPSNAYDNLLEEGFSRGDLLRKLSQVNPVCAVGTCYWYQNISYSLISDVIEQATGTYFEYLVSERLFRPLKMTRASFGMEALTEARNAAQPHIWFQGSWQPTYVKPTYYQLPAAAGINLSLHDLTLWLNAQMGQRPDVLSEPVLTRVHQPLVKTPSEMWGPRWRHQRLENAHYALGFRVYDYQGETLIFHGGAVNGFRAFMVFSPDRQVGMAALWNSNSPRAWTLIPSFFDRLHKLPNVDWVQTNSLIPNPDVRLTAARRYGRTVSALQ